MIELYYNFKRLEIIYNLDRCIDREIDRTVGNRSTLCLT